MGSLYRPVGLSRTAIRGSALVLAGLADAFADSIPPAALEPPAPPSAPSQQTPASAEPFPPNLSSLNPAPLVLPRLAEPQFRADASTPASAAPAPFGFLDLQGQNLLGDMGGLRPALAKYGVDMYIYGFVETFGNLSGGVKQGFEADGITSVALQMDTDKAFGLKGGTLVVSGFQYWGGNLTADNLLVIQTLTGIEAPVGVRLWEAWYQQKFGDKFDIKIGEQALDEEFIFSPSSEFFINGAAGWPALPGEDLPAGGPAYPLAGLGVRGRARVSDNVTVLAGVFNGSQIPWNSPNTPVSNPHGVSFPVNTGTLAIAELQFAFPGSGASGKASGDDPLPGVYKIGAWYDSARFDDLQTDAMGLPLASSLSNGIPATHHGNFSLYGVADQMVWRSKDNSKRSLNVFVRPIFTPYQDRNLVSASINAGFALHGPAPGRDDDIFGVEVGAAWASSGASGFDRQQQFFQPSVFTPIQSSETFIEVSYQFQILPSWQIQPDLQYFINPGLGIANPSDPTQRLKNELVVGLRTNITF